MPLEKICEYCKKNYKVKPSHYNTRKYCSPLCSVKSRVKNPNIIICAYCRKEVLTKKINQKYCSKKCVNSATKRRRTEITCLHCKKIFEVPLSRKDKARFCKNKCKYGYQKYLNNPNYRGGFYRKCKICKNMFYVVPYQKNTKFYCSKKCNQLSFRGIRHTEKDEIIKKYYPIKSNKEVAKLTKLHPEYIGYRAKKLGLIKDPLYLKEMHKRVSKISHIKLNHMILNKEKMEFLKNHKSKLNSTQLAKEFNKKFGTNLNRMNIASYLRTFKELRRSKEEISNLNREVIKDLNNDFMFIIKRLQGLRNLESRKKISEHAKEQWKNPQFRKSLAEGLSKASKKGSRPERYVANYLKSIFGEKSVKYKEKLNLRIIKGLEIDILIPKYKIAIECNGPLHFYPIRGRKQLERVRKNDKRKEIELKKLGWRLYIVEPQLGKPDYQHIEEKCNDIIKSIPKYKDLIIPQRKIKDFE